MNFLAHTLLGFNDKQLIAGQICGDFVRGRDLSAFPDRVATGIRLHRHLDAFADRHPALGEQRRSISHVPLRLSGILLDVLFDHHLAINWQTLSDMTLENHALQVHLALRENEKVMPDAVRRFADVLQTNDILQNNRYLSAIEQTLSKLSRRSAAFAPLALSKGEVEPLRQQLAPSFDGFYPQLRQAAWHYIEQYDKQHIQQHDKREDS
ncbi:MAG: DUF479 domain-containing protein [Granulosicoccus sp.]|nr:DUF479 domain-containing protein [Granulosicoccus sp.]